MRNIIRYLEISETNARAINFRPNGNWKELTRKNHKDEQCAPESCLDRTPVASPRAKYHPGMGYHRCSGRVYEMN